MATAGRDANAGLRSSLDTLGRVGVVGDLPDGPLLRRVVADPGGDVGRSAFAAVVDRHGPMVWGVCRKVLGDSPDAHDAFQATFLVLARKAASVRKADSVASWLHGVALRVARRARSDAARRAVRERRASEARGVTAAPVHEPEPWPELHEEIARLPGRYREPVVLCYLEGLTAEAAASRIGCPRGTVLSRLSRARDRLRRRLTRRGLAPSAAFPAAGSLPKFVPVSLLETTVKASIAFATSGGAAALVAPAAVTTLARGALSAMTLTKLKLAGFATLGLAVAATGVRSQAVQAVDGGGGSPNPAPARVPSVTPSQLSNLNQDRLQLLDAIAEREAKLSQVVVTGERNDIEEILFKQDLASYRGMLSRVESQIQKLTEDPGVAGTDPPKKPGEETAPASTPLEHMMALREHYRQVKAKQDVLTAELEEIKRQMRLVREEDVYPGQEIPPVPSPKAAPPTVSTPPSTDAGKDAQDLGVRTAGIRGPALGGEAGTTKPEDEKTGGGLDEVRRQLADLTEKWTALERRKFAYEGQLLERLSTLTRLPADTKPDEPVSRSGDGAASGAPDLKNQIPPTAAARPSTDAGEDVQDLRVRIAEIRGKVEILTREAEHIHYILHLNPTEKAPTPPPDPATAIDPRAIRPQPDSALGLLENMTGGVKKRLDTIDEQKAALMKQQEDLKRELEALVGNAKPGEGIEPTGPPPTGTAPSPAPPPTAAAPRPESDRLVIRDVPGNGWAAKSYPWNERFKVVVPGEGSRAAILNPATKATQWVRLADSNDGSVEVTPVTGVSGLALQARGPGIARVAVARFNMPMGSMPSWSVQELKEPVNGVVAPKLGPDAVLYPVGRYVYAFGRRTQRWATLEMAEASDPVPVFGAGVAVISLGRYVYAFSAAATRWGTLELPEGAHVEPVVGNGTLSIEWGGHLCTFDLKTGRWNDLDLNHVPESAEPTGTQPPDEAMKSAGRSRVGRRSYSREEPVGEARTASPGP